MVGVVVLAVSVVLGWLVPVGYAWLLVNPSDLPTLTLAVGDLVVVRGHLSYRAGTARLLAGVETSELPPRRAPGLYRRRDCLCHDLGIAPSLLVADIGGPNAVSIGGPRGSAVVLDPRLFSLLSADKLEGSLVQVERADAVAQTIVVSAMRILARVGFLVLLPVRLIAVDVGHATARVSGRLSGVPDVAAPQLTSCSSSTGSRIRAGGCVRCCRSTATSPRPRGAGGSPRISRWRSVWPARSTGTRRGSTAGRADRNR